MITGIDAILPSGSDSISGYQNIHQVLTFGAKKIAPERIILAEYVGKRLEDLKQLFSHRQVEIIRHFESARPLNIPLDPLQKVVDGLIKNAIENTPDEGKIRIRAYKTDNHIAIDCIDHGIGITRENQELIFGGFFHTQETEMYSTKKPFDFNAGGAGIDLLRTKILSEKFGYTFDFVSKRCDFIILDSDECPGNIAMCPHIKNREECYNSGGSTFSIRFPSPAAM